MSSNFFSKYMNLYDYCLETPVYQQLHEHWLQHGYDV